MSDTKVDQYAHHLQAMVQIPTVSGEGAKEEVFTQFRALLRSLYPTLHNTAEIHLLGGRHLLFKLKGNAPQRKQLPLLLMGHQDVVPAGDLGKWKYPPFDGTIADGFVWGRGSRDCKSIVLGELEAIEGLLEEGFWPSYDLYLAFSANEEVMDKEKGAALTVQYLKDHGVPELGGVLDEGAGFNHTLVSAHGKEERVYYSPIKIAEKTRYDFELYAEGPGGHSMQPGQGSLVGKIAQAAVAIEAHPFPYRLTPLVEQQLKALSQIETGEKARIYADPEAHFGDLEALAKTDPVLDSLLHTTTAVTMAKGSPQSNVMPQRASIVVNCRLLEGDTEETVIQHFRDIIPSDVKIRVLSGDGAARNSTIDSPLFHILEQVGKDIYGPSTRLIPSLLAGGTDCRFYSAISKSAYRISGYPMDERWGASHSSEERVPIDALAQGVDFYRRVIEAYGNLSKN